MEAGDVGFSLVNAASPPSCQATAGEDGAGSSEVKEHVQVNWLASGHQRRGIGTTRDTKALGAWTAVG